MDIKPTPKSIIGMLLIIFAIIDFLVGWIGGGDIFSFLPWYISMFTPIIIGGIGFSLMETSGKSRQRESSESDEYDTQRTEKSGVELMEEEERKKKKKNK